jgi:hypothetical protein
MTEDYYLEYIKKWIKYLQMDNTQKVFISY